MTDVPKKKKTTLSDSDVTTRRGIGRRTFLLGAIGGTTAIAGCVPAGITDADPVDPVAMGRGTRRTTGITDSDLGVGSDPAGNGRGRRTTGITDSDAGMNADPAGNGRGRRAGRPGTGITDSDAGWSADPAGNGRGNRRRNTTRPNPGRARACTDSDIVNADPVGRGRRC